MFFLLIILLCVSVFRRKNVLRIPQGWICYLAPEIVRKLSPEVDEDQLPFSKAADIYAFGYWLVPFILETIKVILKL